VFVAVDARFTVTLKAVIPGTAGNDSRRRPGSIDKWRYRKTRWNRMPAYSAWIPAFAGMTLVFCADDDALGGGDMFSD
jgi:hypothetical protein